MSCILLQQLSGIGERSVWTEWLCVFPSSLRLRSVWALVHHIVLTGGDSVLWCNAIILTQVDEVETWGIMLAEYLHTKPYLLHIPDKVRCYNKPVSPPQCLLSDRYKFHPRICNVWLYSTDQFHLCFFSLWWSVSLLSDIYKSVVTFRMFNSQLENNPQQHAAVQRIVAGSSKPAPHLVFGPPGTGKTITLVEAMNQVLNVHDVLFSVCS